MADIDPSGSPHLVWGRILPAVAVGTLLLAGCSSGESTPDIKPGIAPAGVDQDEVARLALEQTIDRLGMERLEQFTMSSGLEATVYSDGDIEIDNDAFDRSFHATLLLGDQMEEPALPELGASMKLLYGRVFESRELAGKRVNFFIASDPNSCIKGQDLVQRGDAPFLENCETNAQTLSVIAQGVESTPSELQMLISAGTLNDEVATHPFGRDFTLNSEQIVASNIAHEGFHAVMRLLGIARTSGEEDLTQLVEAEVLEYYTTHPEEQPIPVKF